MLFDPAVRAQARFRNDTVAKDNGEAERRCELCDMRCEFVYLKSVIPHTVSRIPHQFVPSCLFHRLSVQRFAALHTSSGDHTVVETPVPIPNTVVKRSGPMIVRALAKVGIARFFNPAWDSSQAGFFAFRALWGYH